MNRAEFLRTFSTSTAGLILAPQSIKAQEYLDEWFPETAVEPAFLLDDDVTAGWIFNVLVSVSIKVIGNGIYAACVAGLKNPAACKVVELIATGILKVAKGAILEGIEDGFRYKVKRNENDANIHVQTGTMDDALDVTAVMAHSNCNTWKYLKDIGKYPKASRVNLSVSDVAGLSKWELAIMRNEIYARHGYKFHKNPTMIQYFEDKSWYRQFSKITENDDTIYNHFTEIERSNVEFIKSYEKKS